MGSYERRKGNDAERTVVHTLRKWGWEAVTSRSSNGTEVKNQVRLDLSAWVKQANENAMDKVPVVWHKKRGESDPENWYVTMEGVELMKLLEMVKGYKNDFDGDDT